MSGIHPRLGTVPTTKWIPDISAAKLLRSLSRTTFRDDMKNVITRRDTSEGTKQEQFPQLAQLPQQNLYLLQQEQELLKGH